MPGRIRLSGLVIAIFVVLTGCLSIESEITIDPDGSGQVALTYRVDQLASNLGVFDPDTDVLPLPIAEDDFQDLITNTEGLELISYSRSETPDVVTVVAEIAFSNAEALSSIFSAEENEIELVETGDQWVFRQVISGGLEEAPSEEVLGFFDAFFSDYEMSFSLSPPTEVSGVSAGEVVDGTARWTIAARDVFVSTEPLVWEVRF
jgi:hypothetical protein